MSNKNPTTALSMRSLNSYLDIYSYEKTWMIVVFVNRSHTHVLQDTICTFRCLYNNSEYMKTLVGLLWEIEDLGDHSICYN